jgi:hypothetical protein
MLFLWQDVQVAVLCEPFSGYDAVWLKLAPFQLASAYR